MTIGEAICMWLAMVVVSTALILGGTWGIDYAQRISCLTRPWLDTRPPC
jgi:hypothetical protein